jgi:hypothetical protein
LHLLRVQGFYFCPAAYQPHTSVYSSFFAVHANYTAQTPKPFTGLCSGVSVDFTNFSAHNTEANKPPILTCATLDGTPSSAAPAPIPDTTATPDAAQVSTAALL